MRGLLCILARSPVPADYTVSEEVALLYEAAFLGRGDGCAVDVAQLMHLAA